MNFVTTNIRFYEEDYLRLKTEAAKARVSLSEIVRQKIRKKQNTGNNKKALLRKLNALAKHNSKYMKNIDSVAIIRQIRYQDSW